MATLEIDDLVRRLDARARLRGVSLDAFVRETLTAAAPLGSSEKTALIADFQRRCGPIPARSSAGAGGPRGA